MEKKQIAILCGGRSSEHEISLISAKNIANALDSEQFEAHIIGISREGKWYYSQQHDWLPLEATGTPPKVEDHGEPIAIAPGPQDQKIVFLNDLNKKIILHAIFPILHGTYGEDGTMQGLLEQLQIPYVGPDTLSSATCFDKDITKRLLQHAGIPVAKQILVQKSDPEPSADDVFQQLGNPVFVKPANAGSSIGVSKVTTEEELRKALQLAFQFDKKILIEQGIEGREVECAVLGNALAAPSEIGEIVTPDNFYSYRAKYLDENGSELHAPAKLTNDEKVQLQMMALEAYKVLGCEGLARIDMFLANDGKIYVNEPNTLPGFTKISMYPKLWQETGISYKDLITRLIILAEERFQAKKALKTDMPDEV
ncbi:D-alanine--D-alanine ligase [Candidatus Peregrinibacteria bacterium]|nr:D-alanine--D-alanine ligase [Candidatus Peregrinibacteria bacterium]